MTRPERPLVLSPGSPLRVLSISQRCNALNVNLWRRADSAGWADETGNSLDLRPFVHWTETRHVAGSMSPAPPSKASSSTPL